MGGAGGAAGSGGSDHASTTTEDDGSDTGAPGGCGCKVAGPARRRNVPGGVALLALGGIALLRRRAR